MCERCNNDDDDVPNHSLEVCGPDHHGQEVADGGGHKQWGPEEDQAWGSEEDQAWGSQEDQAWAAQHQGWGAEEDQARAEEDQA